MMVLSLMLALIPSVTLYAETTTHNFTWRVFFYAEPDFRSNIVGEVAPSALLIHEQREDGWGKVITYTGQIWWVYLRGDIRFIDRNMRLFEYPYALRYTAILDSQLVTVLQEMDNWIQIATWLGPKWIDLRFVEPSVDYLDNFFRQFGNRIGIFYMNIPTGFIYMYNPDRVFFGASVPKLYHALYVYTLAERGYISLDTVYTYTSRDHWGGTGVMRHMPVGGHFTTRELLGHSIRDSDNVAFRMLVRNYAHHSFTFRDFVHEIGANPAFILDVISQNTSARDAGVWALAVLNYIESNGRYAHFLWEDLLTTTVNFIRADYSAIAQKYGWYRRHFHDLAIVYAESPYILIILSDKGYDGGLHITNRHTSTHDLFEEISRVMEEFNSRYFGRNFR